MTQGETADDPVQLANTLKAFAELRQSNAISDAEYANLKERVLAALEQRIAAEPTLASQRAAAPQPPQGIQDYAGDLHRLIAEKLAQQYPKGDSPNQEERKRYLLDMAELLLEKRAL